MTIKENKVMSDEVGGPGKLTSAVVAAGLELGRVKL